MKKIKALTQEQEKQLEIFRQEWLAVGLSTQEADRRASEAVILDFYSRIGKSAPVFWWTESPLQANLGIALLKNNLRANLWDNLRDNLRANLRANLWDNLRANLGDNLRANLRANLGDNLGDNLWDNLRANLRANLWDNLRANLRANLWDNLRANLWDNLGANLGANLRANLRTNLGANLRANESCYFWGSLEAPWIAFYLFPHEKLHPMHTKDQMLLLRRWETLAKSCFWWYPFEKICLISNRPSLVMKDSETRLHSESGPAFAFRDGWKGYYWHGVSVPDYVIERPHEITTHAIDAETNAEVRRAMMQRYGEARYLEDSGTKPIHADRYGTLYRKSIEGDDPLVMVKVLNSTPEPDGHFKPYFLRVPPTMQTAHEAVAWTFGMTAEEYKPGIET